MSRTSYGLTLCAERVAIATAVAAGARKLLALAIATENGASPCGACRQFAREFALHLPIHLVAGDGSSVSLDLGDLLPRAFGPTSIVP